MKTFGKYRVEEVIGRGAMGVVYRAVDPFRDQPVALKVPNRDAVEARFGSAFFEGLFYNETRAAGRLRHPNIVQLVDAGIDGRDYYIVMEYVSEAQTLEAYCSGERLLSPERIAEIAFRCAEALDYAHRKGVVHRDIKPSNVLMDRHGVVRLSDFGIAQLSATPEDDTTPLVPAGSPLYMSPEQANGELLTGSSDRYSLGVMLYELLTGVNPFAAETVAAIANRMLGYVPPSPRELRSGISESLSQVVQRCLEKTPEGRFASAHELANALAPVFDTHARALDSTIAEGRVERLQGLPFFAAFRESDIWELLRWAEWCEYAAGTEILTENDDGGALFVLVDGEVEVRKGNQPVVTIQSGECFGEMAFLARRQRSASVVATSKVRALEVSAEQLARASQTCQVVFQRELIETLIQRLAETTALLTAKVHVSC